MRHVHAFLRIGRTVGGMLGFLVLTTTSSWGQSYDLLTPIDQFAFKGTHNSYEQPSTLLEQIDGQNVWCLEFDLCGLTTDLDIRVFHPDGYPPPCGGPALLLQDLLTEMLGAAGWQERVTFLLFDIKTFEKTESGADSSPKGPCCDWRGNDSGIQRAALLQAELESYVGASRFYTAQEWESGGKVWPSLQVLLDQGKHFIPIYNHNTEQPHPDPPFLFVSAENTASAQSYTAMINRNVAESSIIDPNDQFLWRAYGIEIAFEWYDAANRGFNILSTDHSDQDWTFTLSTFPPVPMYVNSRAPCYLTGVCYPTFGTFVDPFAAVLNPPSCSVCWFGSTQEISTALLQMPLHSELVLAPGTYPGSRLISKPMTLSVGNSGLSSSIGSVFLGGSP